MKKLLLISLAALGALILSACEGNIEGPPSEESVPKVSRQKTSVHDPLILNSIYLPKDSSIVTLAFESSNAMDVALNSLKEKFPKIEILSTFSNSITYGAKSGKSASVSVIPGGKDGTVAIPIGGEDPNPGKTVRYYYATVSYSKDESNSDKNVPDKESNISENKGD